MKAGERVEGGEAAPFRLSPFIALGNANQVTTNRQTNNLKPAANDAGERRNPCNLPNPYNPGSNKPVTAMRLN